MIDKLTPREQFELNDAKRFSAAHPEFRAGCAARQDDAHAAAVAGNPESVVWALPIAPVELFVAAVKYIRADIAEESRR